MRRTRSVRRRTAWGSAIGAAALTATAVVGAPAATAVTGEPPLRVIASGFAGPLHVAFGPGDSLYVSDAFAGNLDRVDLSTGATKVVAALGEFVAGVDVGEHGKVYVVGSVAAGDGVPQAPTHLLQIGRRGHVSLKADLLAYELAHNPDGQSLQAPDAQSNPYSVLAVDDKLYVADAGANDILEIRADGRIRTVVALPVITTGACAGRTNNDPAHAGCDPVPTDLEMGDDGYLYVSGLGAEVEGHIYKINPRTGRIVATWGQLPPLTGIAVSHDGTIYAASLFTDTVFRFRHGVVTTAFVPAPTDVEWGHGGLVAGSLSGNVFAVSQGAFS